MFFSIIFSHTLGYSGYGKIKKQLRNKYFSDSEIYMKINNLSEYVL